MDYVGAIIGVLGHNLVKSAMESLANLHASVSLRRFPVEDLLDRQLPVDEETRTICCYVFEESNTALLLERLFAQKDFIQIGKALSKLGKGLRDKIELTCPELDWLSKRSIETQAATEVASSTMVRAAMWQWSWRTLRLTHTSPNWTTMNVSLGSRHRPLGMRQEAVPQRYRSRVISCRC